MKTSDFHYDLPQELIAQVPNDVRSASRLLVYSRQQDRIEHAAFNDITGYLKPGDLLVFNNTRVIPARLYGRKQSGGRVEILIERVIAQDQALAHIRASKTPRPGTRILLTHDDPSSTPAPGSVSGTVSGAFDIEVTGRRDELFEIRSVTDDLATIMESIGHMPLPPYIQRADDVSDAERYQTVYAKTPGAVAAPTAGLHFDQPLLARLADSGVSTAFVTLHVGAGTFQPVRSEKIEDHAMHSEWLQVGQDVVDACHRARQQGGRIIAVGTTSVRSLETASTSGELDIYSGDTDIFIYPGYEYRSVDAMITNFHLPESTLLMLVSAFAGKENIMRCYDEAIRQRYRFFSYGDAMLII